MLVPAHRKATKPHIFASLVENTVACVFVLVTVFLVLTVTHIAALYGCIFIMKNAKKNFHVTHAKMLDEENRLA